MTIDEHLGFSVLSAPVASYDRRSLSQAWYSALYGAHDKPAVAAKAIVPQSAIAQFPGGQSKVPHLKLPAKSSQQNGLQTHAVRDDGGSTISRGEPTDRRSPRLPLARAIAKTFSKRGSLPRKAAFSVEGKAGRVQILLCTSGERVDLVAICSARAASQVAAALAQARYSLARSGMSVNASTRVEAVW